MVGSTVGHYQIVARIGEGVMGLVYRAVDVQLRRPGAVKLAPVGFCKPELVR